MRPRFPSSNQFTLWQIVPRESWTSQAKESLAVPSFNVSVDHQSDRETAVQRLRQFSDIVRRDLHGQVTDVHEQWDDQGNLSFAFQAMGMKISGQLETDETSVVLNGQLPFAALPFRGMIEQQIHDKLREALNTC